GGGGQLAPGVQAVGKGSGPASDSEPSSKTRTVAAVRIEGIDPKLVQEAVDKLKEKDRLAELSGITTLSKVPTRGNWQVANNSGPGKPSRRPPSDKEVAEAKARWERLLTLQTAGRGAASEEDVSGTRLNYYRLLYEQTKDPKILRQAVDGAKVHWDRLQNL